MPYHVKFKHPPAGYAASSAKEGDKAVQVVFREFLSSEDGMELIKRLEGFPTEAINLIGSSSIHQSQIDHMLIHFDTEGNGTVYINELTQIGKVRVRRNVEKGDPVYEDDIVDIEELEFKDIKIPSNHGVLVVFSKGWRKGLYFDFEPILPHGKNRAYNLWSVLGHYYNYLAFQEVHCLSEDTWAALFAGKWFPFVGLRRETINALISWVNSGDSGDEILPSAVKDVKENILKLREKWEKNPIFKDHASFLNKASERFEEEDWISANSILYPRIEGILRSVARSSQNKGYSQKKLSKAPLEVSQLNPQGNSRLLPKKFYQYLKEIYFQNFDPEKPSDISRNSVGHGVAGEEYFSEKAATIGFLIIEQIFYHIPPPKKLSAMDAEPNNEDKKS